MLLYVALSLSLSKTCEYFKYNYFKLIDSPNITFIYYKIKITYKISKNMIKLNKFYLFSVNELKTTHRWHTACASFIVLPAANMSSGSKVIMACISSIVAYVSAWYMLSLFLPENTKEDGALDLYIEQRNNNDGKRKFISETLNNIINNTNEVWKWMKVWVTWPCWTQSCNIRPKTLILMTLWKNKTTRKRIVN